MWKKAKQIEGVSASSAIELKAILAEQQHLLNAGQRPSKIQRNLRSKDVWSTHNKGLADRAKRDALQMNPGEKTLQQQLAESEAKLKEKEKLYNKFVKGEILPPSNTKNEDAEYLVDFELKTLERQLNESTSDNFKESDDEEQQFYHEDIQREKRRKAWEEEALRQIEADEKEQQRREEQRKILNQLIEETKEGRERHKQLQLKRKRTLEERKQQIKLKVTQRLEALKNESDDKTTAESVATLSTNSDNNDNGGANNQNAEVKSKLLKFKETPKWNAYVWKRLCCVESGCWVV